MATLRSQLDRAALIQEWTGHGLSTAPADRARAEAAARAYYKALGYAFPAVTWHDSPLAMSRIISLEPSYLIARGSGNFGMNQFGVPRHLQSVERIAAIVKQAFTPNAFGRGFSVLQFSSAGQLDAPLALEYDAIYRAGDAITASQKALVDYCKCAGWAVFREDGVHLCERMSALHLDEQDRPHSATGMAIQYPDGWGIYAWHGLTVDEHIILRPDTITAQEVIQERNAERRRVLIERAGPAILTDHATLLDEDDDPAYPMDSAHSPRRRLWLFDNGWTDEDIVFISYHCPSTGKFYPAHRVPPDMETCLEAMAWINQVTVEQYQRMVQA